MKVLIQRVKVVRLHPVKVSNIVVSTTDSKDIIFK